MNLNFLKAIQYVLQKSDNEDLVLIGSLNLQLQGIPMEANDVDFLTNDINLTKIAEFFKSKPRSDNKYLEFWTSHNEVTVNFTSYDNNPLRNKPSEKQIVHIVINGLSIPCLRLEQELNFYEQAGREKDIIKIDLIKKQLNII